MKRILLTLITGAVVTGSLIAQTSINWSTVSGGGGASGNGGVLLNGSFGSFSGAPSSSTTVQNNPGFWSGVPTPLFSALPFLKIELLDGSQVQLSWPVTAEGFNLQKATVLAPPDWDDLEIRPVEVNGMFVTKDDATASKFYRLRKP